MILLLISGLKTKDHIFSLISKHTLNEYQQAAQTARVTVVKVGSNQDRLSIYSTSLVFKLKSEEAQKLPKLFKAHIFSM